MASDPVDPSCGCPLRAAQAAKTRAAGVPSDDAPVTPVDPSATPGDLRRLPTLQPIDDPQVSRIDPFEISTADGFWLRPTPTFAHVGPHFPAGTFVVVEGVTQYKQGIYRLYAVRVVARYGTGARREPISPEPTGFAAFRLADLMNRSSAAPGSRNPFGPSSALLLTYGKETGDKAP